MSAGKRKKGPRGARTTKNSPKKRANGNTDDNREREILTRRLGLFEATERAGAAATDPVPVSTQPTKSHAQTWCLIRLLRYY